MTKVTSVKADSRQKKNEYQHRYYAEHRQEEKERSHRYRAEHRQKKKEYNSRYYTEHRHEINERQHRYHAEHRWEAKERLRRCRAETRAAVFNHYGAECVCCGESQNEFLTIDHVNNDGARQRRELKVSNMYAWLVHHNFPAGFQTLCWNCNCSKGKYGYCPHQGKGKSVGQKAMDIHQSDLNQQNGQLQFRL